MFRFFLIAFSLLIISTESFAQTGGGLVISPKRVVFDEKQRIFEVLLANRGREKKRYRITVVNRAMKADGQLEEAQTPAEGEYFAKDVLRLSPRQTVLGPKETQKIKILGRLKGDSPEGEYRSHLLVQEIPDAAAAKNAEGLSGEDLGISVQAVFGLTIPVILRKGDLSAELSLSKPKILREGEHTYLQVNVNRSGSRSVLGTASVWAGQQRIGLLKNVAVYMSTPYREVSIKIDPERAKNLSGQNLRVTFGAEEENEDAPEASLSYTVP